MRNKIYRLIKPFMLMAFCFFLITSCYQPVTLKLDTAITPSSKCRVVQHKLGEVCIPVKPKRIIALDPRYILDPLLSLGIKPVGFASFIEQGRVYLAGLSPDEVAGIETIGDAGQPSLEKIITLKPDLIFSLDYNEKIYKQLSVIAPTVIIDYDKIKFSFQDNFRSIAEFVKQEKKAKEVIAQYHNRVEELKYKLGNQLHTMEAAVIINYHGNFGLMSNESGIYQVLADIGLHHKTVSPSNSGFSIEVIHNYDADVMFIINADNQPSSYFFRHPLISSLKAVKNKRAYIVDPNIWWAYGPIGINRILDDLSNYLLEGA
jgi:iron complex transport system substrate-binding protein